jgi:Leucine-rich repeat (LRR) protein
MGESYEKLKSLLVSNDPANLKLAVELAKSQNNQEILDLYAVMEEIYDFWAAVPLKNFPKEMAGMMHYFNTQGLNFFKNYSIKKIPESHKVLAPYIKSFHIWYTSFHNLPEGLGMFHNIENIEVDGGPITSIRDEVWKLPRLKSMKMSIAKNMLWEDNVEFAQNLEHLELEGKVHPALPPKIISLKNLKSLKIRALGNPKEAKPLENYLWDLKQLEVLDLFGKTIPQPKDDEIGQLANLKKLVVSRTNWPALPQSILEMKDLKTLRLFNLIKIKELPSWFASLAIEELQIASCKFKNAFEIIKELPKLKKLRISESVQKKVDKNQWKAEFGHLDLEVY